MRIGVISNLRAGGSGTRAAKVLEYLKRYPDILCATGDPTSATRELAEAGVEILMINGGDGTLQRALTEVLCATSPFVKTGDRNELPLIVPLRTGRTCMTAHDIGSRRDPRLSIDRLVARVRSGRILDDLVERATIHMVLEPDGVDCYGTFFGVGIIYRGTLITHRVFPSGKAQGVFGSTLVTASLLMRAFTGRTPNADAASGVTEEHPLTIDTMTVDLDGERLEYKEFQLLLASGLHSLLSGVRPFWGKEPGGLHFTALRPGCIRYPQEIARVLRGRRPKRSGLPDSLYESRNVERVDLTLDCGISLDGEMFDPRPGRRATLTADHRIRFLSTR